MSTWEHVQDSELYGILGKLEDAADNMKKC